MYAAVRGQMLRCAVGLPSAARHAVCAKVYGRILPCREACLDVRSDCRVSRGMLCVLRCAAGFPRAARRA
jgi:hypothetical protein